MQATAPPGLQDPPPQGSGALAPPAAPSPVLSTPIPPPHPRKKIMLAGACTSQSLPVLREQRAPAESPCRDPYRAALAATSPGEPLRSA
ncbi:hypothetical protein STEG23_036948 [Scotinomys teguina]